MKKTGVTKQTYSRNAKKFAAISNSAWHDLNAFVDSHCRPKNQKARGAFLDDLCKVVDKYIELNCAIILWCQKNDVDLQDFMCDVENCGFEDFKKELR